MAAGSLDVLVRFIGDSSSIRTEAAKVEGTGGKIKKWAAGVGAALGAAFAIDKLKDFVEQASALQDATAATEQIFGKAAKPVKQFSKDAADSFGISKREALDAADTFATFGKGAGKTGTDLSGFATKLVGLSGDLASFRGTSTEQAITAVGAALRGETEPIRAYGVLLDDATLRARAMKMGLISTTKDALTPQQKVLAAQQELLAQTGDAQGDFARTADSAANQQKKLKAEMENAGAAIGTALLPVVQAVLPWISKLADFIQQNAGWLVPLTAAVLAVVAATWLWNAALAANPIVLIAIGIAALIAGIILLVKNWDKVTEAFKAAFDWVVQNWPLLLAIITGPIGIAVKLIVDNWDTITDAAKAAFGWVKTNWPLLLAIITGPIGLAVLAVTRNFDTIKDAAASVWRWIVDKFNAIASTIAGVIDGISGTVGRIVAAIKGPINAVLRAWNAIEFKVPEVNAGPIHFGGQTIGLPDIPLLDTGGYVTRTGAAVVHRGEAYSGVGGSLGNTYNVNVAVSPGTDPAQTGRAIVELLQAFERANGSDWRRVPA